MNVSSKPAAPTHKAWLEEAAATLANHAIKSARLDAELLLSHTLSVDRGWLHAHGDESIAKEALLHADTLLKRRMDREPIAYITGYKEFYGREFVVMPDVLIPRPESETMIELLKTLPIRRDQKLIDVGTGSGCLGITAKLELPELDVMLCDISESALVIARQNAQNLHADVSTVASDLLAGFPQNVSFDTVLANLPYVDQSWERSPETEHEPALALFADNAGLALIEKLIVQAGNIIKPTGYLLLEADPEQHARIVEYGERNGFRPKTIRDYIVVLQKS